MRSRAQFERLVTFGIATSVPVALYGILQFTGHDPLPWAGDVQTRVASSMGNAIFVAAWLIMVVPLTLQRFLQALDHCATRRRGRAPGRARDRLWPLALIGSAAMFLLLLIQYVGMMTGDRPRAARSRRATSSAGSSLVFAIGLFVLPGLAGQRRQLARAAPAATATTPLDDARCCSASPPRSSRSSSCGPP